MCKRSCRGSARSWPRRGYSAIADRTELGLFALIGTHAAPLPPEVLDVIVDLADGLRLILQRDGRRSGVVNQVTEQIK